MHIFAGNGGYARSSPSSSRISLTYILNLIDRLKNQSMKSTTAKTYLKIWRQFNSFLIHLNQLPKWSEDLVAMFCAFLIEAGLKSATIKTYVSRIKKLLKEDNYKWDDSRLLLSSLTRACKLKNDRVCCRRPISKGLLEILVFELDRMFQSLF